MKVEIETSILGNDITFHLDREVTKDFQCDWKGKYGERIPRTLSEKLLKIPEIKEVTLWQRYQIKLGGKRRIDWDKIIPKIEETLKGHFKEQIEYIKEPKSEWKEEREEIPIKHRVIYEEFESFDSPMDKIERQPQIVKKLFEVPGITEINVWPDNITLEKGELFTWDEVLSKVNKLIDESEEIMKKDESRVLRKEKKLIEKIERSIPNPKLPVFWISALGDEEGKSSMDLGWWNGQIEDILRKIAPLANRCPVRGRVAKYEISVSLYTNSSELLGRAKDYGIPSISAAPPTPKKGFKVLVNLYPDEKEKFVKLLLPGTIISDEDSQSSIVVKT